MANILPTSESQLSPTTDFDFIFVTDTRPLRYYARHPGNERTPTAKSNSAFFDQASLNAFHEEFKSLVLDGNEPSQVDLLAELFIELFDPHELEWENVLDGATLEGNSRCVRS